MAGDNGNGSRSRWSVDQLKEFSDTRIAALDELRKADAQRVDERIDALKEAVLLAHATAKEAVNKAETAVNMRLEGLNESRATINDLVTQMKNRGEGSRVGQANLWGYILGAAGLLSVIWNNLKP